MEEKENEKKEEKGFAIGFYSKKSWKWQVFILLFFLISFGIIAYFLLGSQAYKLVRVSNYKELSSNSFGNKGFVRKFVSFFSSDENIEFEKKARSGFNFEDSTVAQVTNTEDISKEENNQNKEETIPYQKTQTSSSFNSKPEYSRLSPLLSQVIPSGNSSLTSKLSSFMDQEKSLAKVISNREKSLTTYIKSNGKVSALDSLKGAWKLSIYGARLASQDAAKSWTAKVFEGTPDEELSLEYDEKLKSSLDRVNPNSIPNFLKNQDIDLDPIKSLKPSDVGSFDIDKDKTDEEIEKDRKKWEAEMMKNIMNPLFGPFNFNPDRSNSKDEGNSPDSEPDLKNTSTNGSGNVKGYYVDENGNTYDSLDFKGNNTPWGQCLHYCTDTYCETSATCFV